ncbi:Uma2 family endonuclease [Tundrisphaera lichenicola]|uniref:Uma2 family endonuclease n=1 Tax=Tundrisphaera lichenicola TaxID=2029860 RepID=UPI003EBCE878
MSIAVPEVEAGAEGGEQHLVLHGVDWEQYVTINDALPDRSGLRMIYIDGSLTFSTLSRRHDWFEDRFDKIVMVVALQCGIEYEVAGSATFRSEGQKVGVEGDRTYYFGPHAEIMRGPIDIDLSTQPPPDLAIEVELTHLADDAIATYARIGVPEVWRFNVRRKTLAFLLLGEDGVYHPAARSRSLPPLGPEDVLGQLRIAEETPSMTRWFAQLNDWVRVAILTRIAEG